MIIKKKELIEALEVAKRFTAKDIPSVSKVCFDTKKQQLIATDLHSWVTVGLEMEDAYVAKGETRHENWPEEDFRTELMGLKKAQLENLAGEYMGMEVAGTKAEITEFIIRESIIAADEENYRGDEKYLKETFLVDPVLLLNAVKTLSGDMVELVGQEHEQDEYDCLVPRWLSISGYYKGIMTQSPAMFPEPAFEVNRANKFKFVCDLFYQELNFLNQIKPDPANMADFYHHVCFAGKEIVTTDGSRLHVVKKNCDALVDEDSQEQRFFVKKLMMQKLGAIAKDGALQVYADIGSRIEFSASKKNLVITMAWNEIQYPDYKPLIGMEGHDVKAKVSRVTWESMIEQATVLNDSDYKGIYLKFNSGISVETLNPDKGEYGRRFDYADENHEVEPPLEKGINGAYLKNLPTHDPMTFHMSRNENSIIFVEIDDTKLAAIMPMII